MWLNSHDEFYEQAKMCAPFLHPEGGKISRIALGIKFLCFLASLYEMMILMYNCRSIHRFIKDFQYFTTWGVFMTFISLSSGLYLQLSDKPKDKHSPFLAWKLYIFLFEQAFVYEFIITGLFWTVLIDSMINKPVFQDPYQMLGLKMHHSLPLLLLSIDYSISAVPYVKRHLSVIMPICFIYICLNFTLTMVRGKPIYDPLNWKSVISYVLIAGAVIIGYFGYLMFYWVN